MKNLFYTQVHPFTFSVKVGDFPCYFDRNIRWRRLNLAVVRSRNAHRCPKLW